VITGAVIMTLLHLFAALYPSGGNWGFHHLAFYPAAIMAAAALLMVLSLLPWTQRAGLHAAQAAAPRLLRGRHILARGLVLVLFALLFWTAREEVFFLGDGSLIAGRVPKIKAGSEIARLFTNEPLAGYLNWSMFQVVNSWAGGQTNVTAVRYVSIIFGLGSLAAMLWLASVLFKDSVDSLLFAGFVLVSGGSQLFFGYVEDYTPLYFAVLLFVAASVSYLRGSSPLFVPSAIFGLVFSLHFGMITLLPALFFLWYRGLRAKHPLEVLFSLAVTVATASGLLWLCGYTVSSFADVFLHSHGHLLPVTTLSSRWQAYTMFSLYHGVDLLNLLLLLSPLAGVMLLAVAATRPAVVFSGGIVWVFILLVTLCGSIFTFSINSDLGISRDWDLFASFNLGFVITAAFAWVSFVGERLLRQRLMVSLILITLCHTGAWIGINATEQRSIDRFNVLQDARFWGKSGLADASDVLGAFYRDKGEYPQARMCFDRYLKIDSTNPRLWAASAQIDSYLDDSVRQKHDYEKSIECGSNYEAVYLDLARMYGKEGQFDKAIKVLKKALTLDSNLTLVNESLGEYYELGKQSYDEALPYFQRVIAVDPTNDRCLYSAGDCCAHLGNYPAMRYYWTKYLRLRPHAPEAEQLRKIIAAAEEQK
jgi:Tfp pilus assembly protein PilF